MEVDVRSENTVMSESAAITKSPVKSKKPLVIGAAVVLAMAAGGYFFSQNNSKKVIESGATRPVLTVELTPVTSANFERKLLVSGTVMAWDPIQIGSEVSGLKVESIAVDDGARVKKGQVLARLNGSVLRAQLAQQEARLAASRASLVKAIQPNRPEDLSSLKFAYNQMEAAVVQEEANLMRMRASANEAEANARRYDGLVREGAVSAQEGLSRTTQAKTTEADVKSAEARLKAARFTADQARERMNMGVAGGRQEDVSMSRSSLAEIEATVKQLKSQVEQTIILAPCDGLITKRSVHIGDIAMTNKVMFDMVRDGRLELRAQVPESDLSRIKAGQKVEVQAVLAGGSVTVGVVREISPVIDQDSRLGTVRIDLPVRGNSFLSGNFARGEISLGKEPVLAVPSSCVVYKDNRPMVFTVSEQNTAQMRFVEAGERDLSNIEIRSGLKGGESIVARGAGFLKDGDKVKVVKQ